MKPIDAASLNVTQRLQSGASSPVARTEQVASAASKESKAAAAGTGGLTRTISAGQSAPVDHDRVAEIRKAVEQGKYPLVPAKIADAMIAAGYLLRSKS